MDVRRAVVADAEAISALVHELSGLFLASPGSEQAAAFFRETGPERFRELIVATNRFYLVACDGDGLAGFISMRDGCHVSQLFVAPRHQGRGIGRRLWQGALQAAAGGPAAAPVITVDASVGAVAVYQRFGFEATGCRTEQAGLVFVPMARPSR